MNRKEKIGTRFYVVCVLCIILISSVIGLTIYTSKRNAEDDNNLETKKQEMQESVDDVMKTTEENMESEVESVMCIFEITNRGEHIEPILKQWSYLVNQGLAQYVQDNQIKATGAISFEVEMLHGETQFFFECNDEEKTTLVLTYRQHDRNVEVETTDYTQEDMREKARLVGGDTLLESEEDSAIE